MHTSVRRLLRTSVGERLSWLTEETPTGSLGVASNELNAVLDIQLLSKCNQLLHVPSSRSVGGGSTFLDVVAGLARPVQRLVRADTCKEEQEALAEPLSHILNDDVCGTQKLQARCGRIPAHFGGYRNRSTPSPR
eukprot:4369099-Prymnesium_polylepis.1